MIFLRFGVEWRVVVGSGGGGGGRNDVVLSESGNEIG